MPSPPTIQHCLQQATEDLKASSTTPRLDAELLLAMTLQQPRAYLYAWPERPLSSSQWQDFQILLRRRQAGTPVAYLSGQQEFWSLALHVTSATLIPRPETERLVELALQHLPADASEVLDLGTGSGAVALALAIERPDVQITATDIDAEALAVAQANAHRLGLHNLCFRQGDWYAALESQQQFDLVLSNPPYLAADDPHLPDLRFEPRHALVADGDGLAALAQIVRGATAHLRFRGWCLVEHGYTQGTAVAGLLRDVGFTQVHDYCDAEGRPRVAAGCWSQSR